ncbi:MAG: hypothetical protein WC551_00155 [Patescibacteria group bacterium]
MAEDAPRRTTLHAAKQALTELKDEFPMQGTDRERSNYFSMALRFGIEVHAAYGLDEAELFERIGNTIGVSGIMLEAWLTSEVQVHPDFQFGVLATQAALMDENIHACTLVLDRLRLNLDATDWRSELTAFPHLKDIGLEALRRFGGEEAEELAKQISILEEDCPENPSIETRRLILSVIADALKLAIGQPGKQPTDDRDDDSAPQSQTVWVN